MNKQIVAQKGSKVAVGVIVSALIGFAIKFEHMIDDKIDEHFSDKSEDTED